MDVHQHAHQRLRTMPIEWVNLENGRIGQMEIKAVRYADVAMGQQRVNALRDWIGKDLYVSGVAKAEGDTFDLLTVDPAKPDDEPVKLRVGSRNAESVARRLERARTLGFNVIIVSPIGTKHGITFEAPREKKPAAAAA